MIIAISGTPGTGKTSVTELLKNNYKVVHLNTLAKEKGCLKGYDRKRKVRIVDYKCLDSKIDDVPDIVIESHYAHLMRFDILIILRTKPDVLRERLVKKGFSKQKIDENLEAEALGVITEESLDFMDRAFEIDTSFITAQMAADLALKIIVERPDEYRIGKIDWSEEILKWY
ncbi:MAG: adenylate kinase family protein [Candidatus Micrarchaeaceae archaeon]